MRSPGKRPGGTGWREGRKLDVAGVQIDEIFSGKTLRPRGKPIYTITQAVAFLDQHNFSSSKTPPSAQVKMLTELMDHAATPEVLQFLADARRKIAAKINGMEE